MRFRAVQQLANIGAPWLIVASVAGSTMPSGPAAAVAGLATLLGALVGYYVAAALVLGSGGSTQPGIVGFWAGVALIGGPAFGLAGRWFRDPPSRRRTASIALVGGPLVAEGIHQVLVAQDPSVGWIELACGIAAPIGLGRSNRERIVGLGGLGATTLAGVAAFALLDRLNAIATGT